MSRLTLLLASLVLLLLAIMKEAQALDGTCLDKHNRKEMSTSLSALHRARSLKAPPPKSSVGGEYEDYDWWETHSELFQEARKEWGVRHPELYYDTTTSGEEAFEERFIEKDFREAIQHVWANPSPENEIQVRALFNETNAPGVYTFRLFTREFTDLLLEELDHHQASGIPMRRPNGMNRYGAILADLGLDTLVNGLVDRYFRPLAQLLFPLNMGPHDADENYAFVVRYKQGEDVELAEHTDASTVTVNVCLGKEGYEGGSLYFKGVRFTETSDQTQKDEISMMEPGMGVIHLGGHLHAAQPLTGGERINMIVWMYGENGYVRVAPYSEEEVASGSFARWRSR